MRRSFATSSGRKKKKKRKQQNEPSICIAYWHLLAFESLNFKDQCVSKKYPIVLLSWHAFAQPFAFDIELCTVIIIYVVPSHFLFVCSFETG